MPTAAHGGELLSSGYQGVVFKVRAEAVLSAQDAQGLPGEFLIIKEAMGARLVRSLRRKMIRREYTAYLRLEGIPGVPRCYGLNDGHRLMLEFVDGHPLRQSADELQDREGFFAELLQTLTSAHQVGVAHSDLKRKDNILVTPAGRPYLIDFGSAWLRKETGGAINRWLFEVACQIDLNAWVKHKYFGRYEEISTEDAKYFHPTLIERWARGIRRFWRTITRRHWRKARRGSNDR
jgi:RIO-like serine/threonine protein kinase